MELIGREIADRVLPRTLALLEQPRRRKRRSFLSAEPRGAGGGIVGGALGGQRLQPFEQPIGRQRDPLLVRNIFSAKCAGCPARFVVPPFAEQPSQPPRRAGITSGR